MRSVYTKEHLLREQHNPNYLSSVEFDITKLKLSNDINEIAEWADAIFFVIPSAFLHNELQKLKTNIKDKIIISAVKGIIPESGVQCHQIPSARQGSRNRDLCRQTSQCLAVFR